MASTSPPAPGSRRRDLAGLLGGTALLGMGERLGERFLPLFLDRLGGGPLAVGLYQSAANLLGAVLALPGGMIADRLGTKRALQIFGLAAGLGLGILALSPAWPMAIVGALLGLTWSAVSLPAALVRVTSALPAAHSAWAVTLHSLVRRVPMTVGPLIAGALVAARGDLPGLRAAFALAFVFALAGLGLQQVAIRPDRRVAPAASPRWRPWTAFRDMSPSLRSLFLADTAIRFCEQIPYAFVILWCLQDGPATIDALQFGQLTALEMIVSALAYAPGAWLAGRIGKRATVVVTFVFFTAFPLALLWSRSPAGLVLAFVLRGLKELGEPTRKSLILDLCPPESRATTFGGYYALRDTLAAVAAASGAWLWSFSPPTTLAVAAGCGAVGLVGYAWPRRASGS